jgi:Icc-related predicted phosphoesterase
MVNCFFVTDLHGNPERYQKLFQAIGAERPESVFIGGDFLPTPYPPPTSVHFSPRDFIYKYLLKQLICLRRDLKNAYPRVFLIMGNDDPRCEEAAVRDVASQGIWEYIHNRKAGFHNYQIYGYSYVPPTPFRLKDWERYDVSRFVDPGSISPEEGIRSFPVLDQEKRYTTIQDDLACLTGNDKMDKAVFLFHSPPYKTALDLAGLEGKMIDHVPLDPHVGSIAVRRFIESRQPLLTLHGHVHESARLSSSWRDLIGHTHCFSASHDRPELALIRFDPDNLAAAARQLI